MKLDEILLRRLKFSTTVNDNDNIIKIQKYQYIRIVYLIIYIQRGNGTDTAFDTTYLFNSSVTPLWGLGVGLGTYPMTKLTMHR